jgi:hypothetical protein
MQAFAREKVLRVWYFYLIFPILLKVNKLGHSHNIGARDRYDDRVRPVLAALDLQELLVERGMASRHVLSSGQWSCCAK